MIVILLTTLIILLPSLTLAQNVPNAGLPVAVNSDCKAKDFENSGSCTLSCSLISPLFLFNFQNWFSYYVSDPNTDVTVHGFISNMTWTDSSYNYTTSVELTSYNAGTYQCNFQYTYPLDTTNQRSFSKFKIAEGNGKMMNENCEDASECYALNADCDNSQCHCDDIPFNDNPDNPACLQHEDEGEFCNTQEECEVMEEDYGCVKENVSNSQLSTCECMGYYTYDDFEQKNMCKEIPGPFQMTVDVTRCTAADFANGNQCQMICKVELNDEFYDLALYKLDSYSWKYYIDGGNSGNPNVIIFANTSTGTSEGQGEFSTYLTMSSYNAGQYLCLLVISYNGTQDNFYGPFITIDDSVTPVDMGDSCNASTECLALNSVCNATCQCPDDYNIPDNTADGVLACLAPEGYYEKCNIDAECVIMEFTVCEDNKCVCQPGSQYNGLYPDYYCQLSGVLAGECTPHDFDNSSCTTWCAYDISDHSVSSYEWTYGDYTFSSDDVTAVTSEHILNISLTLTDYYYGTYECWFDMDTGYTDEAYHSYRISTSNTAVSMGEPCDDKSSCVALNAECVSLSEGGPKVCTCTGNNSVEYKEGYSNNPACLPPAGYGEPCQSDNQCSQGIYNSYCANGLCQCREMSSDSQCATYAPVDYDDDGLSVGAIVGIAIGSLVGCAIIIGIIVYVVKKK